MKTLNNIWDEITSTSNIENAYKRAKKGKSHYSQVKEIENNHKAFLGDLRSSLINNTYQTSTYQVSRIICGGKERILHKLPFYPDRIAHHAFMNVVSPFWYRTLIRDTYQSIPGRGTSDGFRRVRKAVQSGEFKYALKIDVVKYYPSLTHDITLNPDLYRIRDSKAYSFLENLILSLDFLPLGNHPSQGIGNLVLSPLDWYCKQDLGIKAYFRYCDDIVLLSSNKEDLKEWRFRIEDYLNGIGLEIKDNSEIYDIHNNYLDFIGYRFNSKETLLRKQISNNYKQALKERNLPSLASYKGWLDSIRANNLLKLSESLL